MDVGALRIQRMMKVLGARRSFRRELVVAMGGVLVLSGIGSAVLVTFLTYERTARLGQTQAEQFVSAVAPEMSYGLLIARDDNSIAKAMLATLARRPDVTFAQLSDQSAGIFVDVGSSESSLDSHALKTLRERASSGVTSLQTPGHWHVLAPVTLTSTVELGGAKEHTHLGHLYVVWSRADYESLYRSIALTIALGTLLTLAFGLTWTVVRSRRLTQPIVSLAHAMDNASADEGIRARGNGTVEIDQMAAAFNKLMQRLEEHRDGLERVVAERTADLRSANDELRNAIYDAQQAERFKSAFLAAVSHEMKTPLHSIDASLRDALHECEFLQDDVDASDLRAHLGIALAQKQQLLSMINQILDYARAKAGRHTLYLRTVRIEDMVQRLQRLFLPIARENDNSLVIRAEGQSSLMTDADKLGAICINLLSNACKYTTGGTVSMCLSVFDGQATLVVEDNGCGIDAHLLDAVWEEFRQGDMGENRTAGGTGLGLAVTRAFVQLLGGTAVLHSTKGKGTRVTVRLPTASTNAFKTEDNYYAELRDA